MSRYLIKKRRQAEVSDPNEQKIGLYVDPTNGKWYALVPEVESGKLYHADTKDMLIRALNAEFDRMRDYTVTPVLRIVMIVEHPGHHGGLYGITWGSRPYWRPSRPDHAGSALGVQFHRFWRTTTGKYLDWVHGANPQDQDNPEPDLQQVKENWWSGREDHYPDQFPGSQLDLPYSREQWQQCMKLQACITATMHQLRLFLAQPEPNWNMVFGQFTRSAFLNSEEEYKQLKAEVARLADQVTALQQDQLATYEMEQAYYQQRDAVHVIPEEKRSRW